MSQKGQKDAWSLTQVCIIRVRLPETENVRRSETRVRSSFVGDMHASWFNEKNNSMMFISSSTPKKDIFEGHFFGDGGAAGSVGFSG